MLELTDTRREILGGLCDTIVPAIGGDPDHDGFFAQSEQPVGAAGGRVPACRHA